MCCMICSRRGITYFGVAIHLATGLIILPVITVVVSLSVGSDGSGRDLTTFNVTFMTVYTAGILLLGFIIFQGVKQEAIGILRVSTGALFFFQIGAFVITVVTWRPSVTSGNTSHAKDVIRIGSVILNGVATLVYVSLLILYMRHLHRKRIDKANSETSSFYDLNPK